ncbi:MAG: hypothetical protein NTW28_35415, partial [Candidatus Solibacter sp.]|nr:hypothetical protein [Candidatus Solibacter sp.]
MLLTTIGTGLGQPTIQFSAATYTVAENAGSVSLPVWRLNDTNGVVTVDYATADLTATNGLKYTAVSGTLAFAAGENEGFVEGPKYFRVVLSDPTNAVLGTRTTATVSITDNDVGLQLEFSSYQVSEAEGYVLLAVIRGDDGNQTESVDFATSDLTAIKGVNYSATNGTLTFAPGQQAAVFTVPILNNGIKGADKMFRVSLSNPSNQVLGSNKVAMVTIVDNDTGVQIERNGYWVQDRDGALTVRVLRGNDVKLDPFTVDFATSDLSATSGRDYTATTGTLAFAQNELTKTVTVPILYQAGLKADRQFKLLLSNATGGVVFGTNTTATNTILDTTGLTPHRFDQVAALPDGSVRLSLQGGVSRRFKDYFDLYPIEVSSNLVDWIPLVTLQRTNAVTNALAYTDTSTGNWPVRFYRTPVTNLITPFSVKPSGPYAVGVRSRLLTDSSRRNRYALSTNGSFMVSVWYPAVPQAGRLPGPLLDAQIAQQPVLAQALQSVGASTPLFVDRMPQFVGYALPDVPCAPSPAPYPIVICSPPFSAWRATMAQKAANFASHGYIVVVSDPGDSFATVFPDGTFLTQFNWPGLTAAVYQDRLRDLTFILDELTRWNTDDPVFAGRLDLASVATLGVCCGYADAAEFCFNDPRCRAAILVSCTP